LQNSDVESIINPLLPSKDTRSIAMGVIGLLTLPPIFAYKTGYFPDDITNKTLSFDGAN